MKARWLPVDTRRYSRNGRCPFDGFVHYLPRAMATIHEINILCWCDPKVSWPEDGVTIFVTHRNLQPEKD